MMLLAQALFLAPFFGLATNVVAVPIQEIDITPRSENATYIHCGSGTTLTNFDDPYCAEILPSVGKVFRHDLQDDGTWVTSLTNTTVEEAKAASKISARHTEDELSGLMTREVPCRTYKETWFDTDNWGYWYNQWKQVGQCFYCDSCDYSAQYSASVSQTWTTNLGAAYDSVISAAFGYSWGYSQGFSNSFTCHWNKGETSGCHSIWFQPQMTYHNGWPNYQTRASNPAVCGFTTTNHQYTYANVNQFPNHNGDINSGNWGCDSGCQGSDHRQCNYGNTGGSLWPSSN